MTAPGFAAPLSWSEAHPELHDRRPVDALAVAAFVCGVLAFPLPLTVGLTPLGLGIGALCSTRARRTRGAALAVAGICLGTVQLILLLVLFLLPAAQNRW